MSNRSFIFCFILIVFVMVSCDDDSACDTGSQKLNCLYLFIDYTDSLNYVRLKENQKHDSAQLSSVFSMDACNSGRFRLVHINDLGESEDIPLGFGTISKSQAENRYMMPKAAAGFFRKIQEVIKKETHQSVSELERTNLFEPLCKKLKQLIALPRGRKVMIMYSDMIENSDLLNMYKNKSKLKDPETTLKAMQVKCHCELPKDLSAVEINVINHRDSSNGLLIRDVSYFWQTIFENRRVSHISIGSTLDIKMD